MECPLVRICDLSGTYAFPDFLVLIPKKILQLALFINWYIYYVCIIKNGEIIERAKTTQAAVFLVSNYICPGVTNR